MFLSIIFLVLIIKASLHCPILCLTPFGLLSPHLEVGASKLLQGLNIQKCAYIINLNRIMLYITGYYYPLPPFPL